MLCEDCPITYRRIQGLEAKLPQQKHTAQVAGKERSLYPALPGPCRLCSLFCINSICGETLQDNAPQSTHNPAFHLLPETSGKPTEANGLPPSFLSQQGPAQTGLERKSRLGTRIPAPSHSQL